MNFMNNSIFQRNKACEREEENPEEGGVLAVWGSPSSGKNRSIRETGGTSGKEKKGTLS